MSLTLRLLVAMTLVFGMNRPLAVDAATAPGAGAAAAVSPLPSIPFEKYVLGNGLQVILVENHRLPLVAVNIWYRVGAANERPGLTGFAHLFEHMMFAGTKHIPRGVAERLLEAAGGSDSNASTGFDRTNYFDTTPSNQLELNLWTHADRMGYLLDALDETALANQQDVVRNELRQNYDNRPYGIVDLALYRMLFPQGHPYRGAVIGTHADVQAARLDDLKRFFKLYYAPNNASLVIAGDIDKAVTKKLVDKYFGSFKRGPAVPRVDVVTPPITSERCDVWLEGPGISSMVVGEPTRQFVRYFLICPGKDNCASSLEPSRSPPPNWYSPKTVSGVLIQPVRPLKLRIMSPRPGLSLNSMSMVRRSGALAKI